MKYDALVDNVAYMTGLTAQQVRDVLTAVPNAFSGLKVGDTVRTPLGVFRKVARKERAIVLPDGKTSAQVVPATIVKLRPGSRLRSDKR